MLRIAPGARRGMVHLEYLAPQPGELHKQCLGARVAS